jgi:hypothetical protein
MKISFTRLHYSHYASPRGECLFKKLITSGMLLNPVVFNVSSRVCLWVFRDRDGRISLNLSLSLHRVAKQNALRQRYITSFNSLWGLFFCYRLHLFCLNSSPCQLHLIHSIPFVILELDTGSIALFFWRGPIHAQCSNASWLLCIPTWQCGCGVPIKIAPSVLMQETTRKSINRF